MAHTHTHITIAGKDYPFALNHSALKLIKTKHGKTPTQIADGIQNIDPEITEMLLHAGLNRGAIAAGTDPGQFTDEFITNALDDEPALAGIVVQQYGTQVQQMFEAVKDWAEKNQLAAG